MQNLILSLIVMFTLSSCLSDASTTDTSTSKDSSLNLFKMMNEAHYAFEQRDYPFYLFKMKTICDIAPEFPYFIFEKAKAYLVNNQKEACLDELAKLVALDSPMSLRIETDPVFQYLQSNPRFQSIISKIDKEQQPIVNSEKAYEFLEDKGMSVAITYRPSSKSLLVGLAEGKIVEITDNGKVRDFIKKDQNDMFSILELEIDESTTNLWACGTHLDTTQNELHNVIYRFHSETGKLLQKFELNDNLAHQFTDMIIVNDDIYIADSHFDFRTQEQSNMLYVIPQSEKGTYQKIASFITSPLLQSPYNITSDGQNLYVGTQFLGVLKIDIATKVIERIIPKENLTLTGGSWKYYDGYLIGSQPDILGGIFKYKLEGNSVTEKTVIERYHPIFNLPSSSVIVGDALYYIADKKPEEQKELEAELIVEGEAEELKTITILKTKLTN